MLAKQHVNALYIMTLIHVAPCSRGKLQLTGSAILKTAKRTVQRKFFIDVHTTVDNFKIKKIHTDTFTGLNIYLNIFQFKNRFQQALRRLTCTSLNLFSKIIRFRPEAGSTFSETSIWAIFVHCPVRIFMVPEHHRLTLTVHMRLHVGHCYKKKKGPVWMFYST